MINAIKLWWENHVQKTLGSILMTADGLTLAALAAYHDDIVQLLGQTRGLMVYSGARMAIAGVMVLRAIRKKKAAQ